MAVIARPNLARMTIVFLALVAVFGLLVDACAWLMWSDLTHQTDASAPKI